jgi:hypothetical protein
LSRYQYHERVENGEALEDALRALGYMMPAREAVT